MKQLLFHQLRKSAKYVQINCSAILQNLHIFCRLAQLVKQKLFHFVSFTEQENKFPANFGRPFLVFDLWGLDFCFKTIKTKNLKFDAIYLISILIEDKSESSPASCMV
ncbi:hypothetical protein BpHYR1_003945 [Brachionus plicatilis]|uniref:Uncharacterized protein n=1 Tax=Brachionus plicatilis TaxID=10195 RepID=A0A3M7S7X8_BRAPC|nr:hypothetical protein BpHYR1_003945 [Brachionus plicatilis]